MARRKKLVVRRELLSPRALLGEEPRGSVAVTVSWMLTLLATGGALLIGAATFLLAHSLEIPRQQNNLLLILPGLMLISAAVTGVLCLLLTVVVYRVRRDPPPIAITVAAVFVGCLPLATILVLSLRE